ncbi:CBO0543 family protein [Bacillus sp. SG-1]|uniref:CBO0543 family protein n=1 Tax=Bacillus sp. SG-1 TaxID=161544 RepID=UPI003FA459F2
MEVIPTIPAYFLWDFSILPVIAMLLIQYKPQMSVYYKAAIYSLGSSFLGEPLFEAIGFYKKIHWEYYYSVPIQFIIFVIASILYSRIDK